jgi:predicted protein tyrosine phosphatase
MSVQKKIKILFICTANMQRSPTAEKTYSKDERFEVKSAGTENFAIQQITQELIDWSDYIVVMETQHKKKILKMFPDTINIIVLHIPDDYDYGATELIDFIRRTFESAYLNLILPGKTILN